MPGFDKRRVLNICASEIESLLCCICLGVVNKPIQLKCCKQLCCEDCINEWMRHSSTCPYDRRAINESSLQKAEQFYKLLKKCLIFCDYQEYGCYHVCSFDLLDHHLLNCVHNPERLCEICFLTVGDARKHNCVQSLMSLNSKLSQDMQQLRNDYIKLKDEIDCYRQLSFEEERHLWDSNRWC